MVCSSTLFFCLVACVGATSCTIKDGDLMRDSCVETEDAGSLQMLQVASSATRGTRADEQQGEEENLVEEADLQELEQGQVDDQAVQKDQDEMDDDVDGERPKKAKNVRYRQGVTFKSAKSGQYMEPPTCSHGGAGAPCSNPTGESGLSAETCKSSLVAMLPRDGNKGKVMSGQTMTVLFEGCRRCNTVSEGKRAHLGGFFSGRKVTIGASASGPVSAYTILLFDDAESKENIVAGDEVMLQWADKNAPDIKLTLGTTPGPTVPGGSCEPRNGGNPEGFTLYSKKDMKQDPTKKELTKFIIELA